MRSRSPGACAVVLLIALICASSRLTSATPPADQEPVAPSFLAKGAETLHYAVDWRVFDAGTAKLTLTPGNKDGKPQWQSDLKLESSGVIAALFRIEDHYDVHLEDNFCAVNSVFSAQEGKRNRETRVSFDRARGRASYVERDRVKNVIVKAGQTDTPTCVSDVIGAMYKLRTMKLEPGQSARVPVSDGKKSAQVRVDAQAREEVVTKLGKFKTIRYEAFLFNGVLFSRRATLEIWVSDDERRLPVQLRVRLPIIIGTITLQLDKEDRS